MAGYNRLAQSKRRSQTLVQAAFLLFLMTIGLIVSIAIGSLNGSSSNKSTEQTNRPKIRRQSYQRLLRLSNYTKPNPFRRFRLPRRPSVQLHDPVQHVAQRLFTTSRSSGSRSASSAPSSTGPAETALPARRRRDTRGQRLVIDASTVDRPALRRFRSLRPLH